ncbi:MAG TPA: type IV secretion system protein DotC [Coxiellaceae bacterium]|nr:type IV secretion system protein DotC [Coxiellaceae bacterium]|tara:strand:- start:410 stop:1219 length:810 start_codon:yes stop_codon:yes gene_type:complete
MSRALRKKIYQVVVASSLLIAASGVFASDTETVYAQLGYIKPSDLPQTHSTINKVRLQAIEETATGLGAKGALAWRAKAINQSLSKEQSHLENMFNFNQLLLEHNVLPPVLVESDNNLSLDGDSAIRLNSKTYKIIQPARFVTTSPTWREYLWMNYNPPSVPSKSLLPETQDEAKVWNACLKKGWLQGVDQANDIFRTNLDRMKRDFLGMVLYRKLLSQHMVSSPFVAQTNLGVTGDANEIHINDQVLRITANSKLQTDASKWQPVFTH